MIKISSGVVKPSSLSNFRLSAPESRTKVTMSGDTAVATSGKKNSLWNTYLKTMDTLTTLFPLWTVLFAGLALYKPSTFSWFTTKYFTASLGALMLSMGITLTVDDFVRVAKEPK
eukprot:gene45332-55462_t